MKKKPLKNKHTDKPIRCNVCGELKDADDRTDVLDCKDCRNAKARLKRNKKEKASIITDICSMCGGVNNNKIYSYCTSCRNEKARERWKKTYKHIGYNRKKSITEVCSNCGEFNDKYPKNSTCKKCINEAARLKYKKYGKKSLKQINEEPWTFSYWYYCKICKTIVQYDTFNYKKPIVVCNVCKNKAKDMIEITDELRALAEELNKHMTDEQFINYLELLNTVRKKKDKFNIKEYKKK